ncbi:MAG TPA: SxtJ family membrane protein [Nitrospira sp.]|nr:SxtJ family membrane protein [Nitrospira sp.]HNI69560.1 SxtJ family membrane protein [Nitrospira sp.]
MVELHGAEDSSKVNFSRVSSNREFGCVFTVFFLVLFVILYRDNWRTHSWLLYLSASTALVTSFAPALLGPLNRFWQRVGHILHSVISPISLALVFFVVVMPIGLLMRLFDKDLLRLRLNHQDVDTYWIERKPFGPSPESFSDQF